LCSFIFFTLLNSIQVFMQISAINKIDCDNCLNSVIKPATVHKSPIYSSSSFFIYVNCAHTSFIVNYITLMINVFSILNIIVPFCYVNYYIIVMFVFANTFVFWTFFSRDYSTIYFCYSLLQQHTISL
jgi:hypothetical protein